MIKSALIHYSGISPMASRMSMDQSPPFWTSTLGTSQTDFKPPPPPPMPSSSPANFPFSMGFIPTNLRDALSWMGVQIRKTINKEDRDEAQRSLSILTNLVDSGACHDPPPIPSSPKPSTSGQPAFDPRHNPNLIDEFKKKLATVESSHSQVFNFRRKEKTRQLICINMHLRLMTPMFMNLIQSMLQTFINDTNNKPDKHLND